MRWENVRYDMMYNTWKEINKQLEEGMMEYERVFRQVLEDGTYRDPYHVEQIELTKKRQRNVLLV